MGASSSKVRENLKLTPQATLKLTPSWTLVKEGIWTTSTPIWSSSVGFAVSWASRCQTVFLVFSLTIGLYRADSVLTLTRRLDARLKASSELCDDLTEIVKGASAPAA